jgi:hypothetical protein
MSMRAGGTPPGQGVSQRSAGSLSLPGIIAVRKPHWSPQAASATQVDSSGGPRRGNIAAAAVSGTHWREPTLGGHVSAHAPWLSCTRAH